MVLLLLNCFSVCFADNPKVPAVFREKSIPWIFVESNNGVDTYLRIMRYKQRGQQYRVAPEEKGDIDVLYDYKSESKAVITSMTFDYLKNTYNETLSRAVWKYTDTNKKSAGDETVSNTKVSAIPQGSSIEKIANISRICAPKLIERCLAGTYMPKTSDGDIAFGKTDLRVIKGKDNSFEILFFPGDNKVLSGKMDGKTNYCSVDYAVCESRQDGSLIDGASLWVYVSMGDNRIDNYSFTREKAQYDIYGLKISGGAGQLYYELERKIEGTMSSQRNYSGEGRLSWVGNS